MKSIRKTVIEEIITDLKGIQGISTMKTSDFSEELKEKTALWRNSWICDPLLDIIEKLEREHKRTST